LQSEGYDTISGAKAAGNLKEAENEAEASTADTPKLSMKSPKAYPSTKIVLCVSYPCLNIILDTSDNLQILFKLCFFYNAMPLAKVL